MEKNRRKKVIPYLLMMYSWFLLIVGVFILIPGILPEMSPIWLGAVIVLLGVGGITVTMGHWGE